MVGKTKAEVKAEMNREQIKAEALEEFGEEMDKLLEWREGQDAPTLAEFEEAVMKLRKRIGERVLEKMIEGEEATQPVPGPKCPSCGEEMRNKGKRGIVVESQVGTLHLKRGYYSCPQCGEHFSPSGPPTVLEGEALE